METDARLCDVLTTGQEVEVDMGAWWPAGCLEEGGRGVLAAALHPIVPSPPAGSRLPHLSIATLPCPLPLLRRPPAEKDVLTDLATGKTYSLKPLGDVSDALGQEQSWGWTCGRGGGAPEMLTQQPPLVRLKLLLQAGPVIDAGGLFDYARSTGMIQKAA